MIMELQEILKEKLELEEEMNEALNEFMERTNMLDIDVVYEQEFFVSDAGLRYLSKSKFRIIVKI